MDVSSLTPLGARKVAEDKVAPMLRWPEEEQALLFDQMTKLGWTRDHAKRTLQKAKWWLG